MFTSTKPWSLRSTGPETAVITDADQLIKRWGDAAYDVAGQISIREDMGFLASPVPGYWSRVQGEIGQRFGRQQQERKADFAPRRDRERAVASPHYLPFDQSGMPNL